jgi:hypothetical protein
METRSQLRTWSAWCFQRCAQQIDKHWALYNIIYTFANTHILTYMHTCIHADDVSNYIYDIRVYIWTPLYLYLCILYYIYT